MGKIARKSLKGVSLDTFEQPDQSCPNCSSKGLFVFYAVDNIPVNSCILMFSKEEAFEYPRGNLQLGFCSKCGFITNTLFDPNTHKYSARYEETQGYSACFNEFAKSLAQRMIDKYDIHKQTVLEIGCGKGEFLALMCQLGDNHGIGIDPAYVPERNPDQGKSQIEFIQDFYSEKYSHINADVICCRHTLEHIASTWKFIRTLRRAIADQRHTLVFFELPDVLRVLREGAFWDIYYEHCSYFSAGSLARLFRASGLEIDELYLDYGGQYLVIAAHPAEGPTVASLDLENDMELLARAFEGFGEKCLNRINYWQSTMQKIIASGQKMVIWGSSSKGVAFLTTLKVTSEIEYVVDINPYKHGKYMPGTGQEIVSPQFLTKYRPQKIIVMNPVYCNEIQEALDYLNVKADLLAV